MFSLDLKRADVAMAGGRLDEAYRILQASDQRNHRDGQRLTDRLVAAFVDRATQHLQGIRLQDARCDAERARQLGGRQQAVAELLQDISLAETEQRRRKQENREVLASAEQQMRAGAFAAGVRMLDDLKLKASEMTAAAADRLATSMEARQAAVEQAAEEVRRAIDREDYETAVLVISRLRTDEQSMAEMVLLARQVAEPLAARGLAELAAGRVDRAVAVDRLLQSMPSVCPEDSDLRQCLERCRLIQQALAAHRYADAETQLGVLSRMITDATWVDDMKHAVNDIVSRLNQVASGPLGLMPEASSGLSAESPVLNRGVPAASHRRQSVSESPAGLPSRSVLQVDGLGRLLLLTGDVISVCASSRSSHRIDVPLLTEGQEETISIRRDGGDYFAESAAEFRVNGQLVTRRLLATGDTIAVGSRGRLKFLKPVPASSSAVLQITGSRLPQRDIRSIVLMGDSLLFGQSGAHFRVGEQVRSLVLYGRQDGYELRESAPQRVHHPRVEPPPSVRLTPGESVMLQDIRFVLEEASR